MTSRVYTRTSTGKTLSADEVNAIAAAAFRQLLSRDPESLEVLANGASSTNVLAQSEDKSYVVRLDPFRPPEDARDDERYASIANSSGVLTPPRGIGVVAVDGTTVSVRPFVPGVLFNPVERSTSPHYGDIGSVLGRIHLGTTESARPCFYGPTPMAYLERLRVDIPTRGQNQGLVESSLVDLALVGCDRASRRLEAALSSLPRSLIHCDYKQNNILVTSSLDPLILDWEKATVWYSVLDLAIACFHVGFARQDALAFADLRLLLSGYHRSRLLHSEEIEILPAALECMATTFFLTDLSIALRTVRVASSNAADRAHLSYFRSYCATSFRRYAEMAASIDSDLQSLLEAAQRDA